MQEAGYSEAATEIHRWTLEERQAAGDAIRELEETPGWEIVNSIVDGIRKRKMSELVADTKGREASEYARALGEIHGLQVLSQVVEAVRAKAQAADNELEQRVAGASA